MHTQFSTILLPILLFSIADRTTCNSESTSPSHSLSFVLAYSPAELTFLKTPDAFLKTVDQHVSPGLTGSQPECGLIIVDTITLRPSSIIGRFRSSHDDIFQMTPVTSSFTSDSFVRRRRFIKATIPFAFLIARLFSSFCRP